MLYVWSEHHTEINLKQMFSYYSIPFCHSHILRFVILLIFPLSVQPLKPHFQNIFIYDLFHIASNCIAHYTTYLMHIECVSYSYTNLCIPNIVQQKKIEELNAIRNIEFYLLWRRFAFSFTFDVKWFFSFICLFCYLKKYFIGRWLFYYSRWWLNFRIATREIERKRKECVSFEGIKCQRN